MSGMGSGSSSDAQIAASTRRPPRIPIRYFVKAGTWRTAPWVVIDRDRGDGVVAEFDRHYEAQQWVKEHQERV